VSGFASVINSIVRALEQVVLQPVLRQLATEKLREHFLTVPIGPEAREKR
jgi:hypothetical protein